MLRALSLNAASVGVLYGCAEATQQRLSKGRVEWDGVGRVALLGAAAVGPFLFGWYRALEAVVPRLAARVVADQAISSPICISIFFTGMSALEGKKDIFADLKNKFWSTYKVSCCFWLPAQTLNFAFVPSSGRVLYVGAASFVWVNILCLIRIKYKSSTQHLQEHPESERK